MGVTSRSTKKKGDSKFSLLVVMLIVVGIPFLTVKLCTSKSSTASSENTAVTYTVDSSTATSASSEVDGSSSADETSANSVASSSSENVIGAKSTSTGTTYTDNGYSNSGLYNQTYTKDKDGVYKLVSPVMDTANVLSKTEYNELNDYLLNLDKTTGVQIAVLTVKSLGGEDIASYSMKHAESWKLGQKGVDNGALLTVAMQEHDVRIETGYGTEGTLTDAKCARIIRNVIIPDFKSGDYGEGIVAGVKNMAGVITSDDSLVTANQSADESEENDKASVSDIVAIIILVVLFFLFIGFVIIGSIISSLFPESRFAQWMRRNNNHRGGMHGGFGGGGFSGGGCSGGGGFSGGGGGFGGGGASGHW